MKRILSVILCMSLLLSLWACTREDGAERTGSPDSGKTAAVTDTTEDLPLATFPNAADALSEESILEPLQVGDYQESVLLADVPGQGGVALLSVRSDGTLDYIFCNPVNQESMSANVAGLRLSFRDLSELGLQYYTVSPEGEATQQPSDWLGQLDQVLSAAMADVSYADSAWYLSFSAREGTILIYANLRGGSQYQYTAIFQLKDNQLTQLPFSCKNEYQGQNVGIPSDLIGRVYAGEDGYLMNAGNFYLLSYDGSLLNWKQANADTLWGVLGFGGQAAWLTNAQQDKLIMTNPIDFSTLGEYHMEQGDIACSAATPDGSALYLMRRDQGSSQYQLLRFGEGGQEALIEDTEMYAFSNPAANPVSIAADGSGTVYLWLQETGRGTLRRYRYNPEGKQEPQTFTVYSLEDNQTVRTAVSLWNQSHADSFFRYIVASDEIAGTVLTLDDAITQLNTQLVNGEGPDVLILDGLPVDSIIDKGFLHPLTDLDTTGVYPKILERFSMDGTLYAVPGKMTPYLLGRAVEGTVPIASLEEFADVIVSATEKLNCVYMATGEGWDDVYKKALYYVEFPDQLFDLWYPAWCDAIWEGNSFHPEVYQELLTQTGRLSEHYSLQTFDELLTACEESGKTYLTEADYTVINITDANNNYAHTYPYCLAATNYVGLYNFVPDPFLLGVSDPEPIGCEIIGIPGPDGTGATVPTAIAAVREGGNTEAGLEFLQLLLSDQVQLWVAERTYTCDGYPVKWNCTPALLEKMEEECHNTFDMQNDFRATLSELDPVILYELPYSAAKEAALRYYEGKLTAQEAADQVAEATAIYLAEQRW